VKRFVWAAAIVGCFSAGAQAQTLRSDSPLWTYQNEPDPGLYPEHFVDQESFGCAVPLHLGVYRRTSTGEDADISFMRVANYGVFHCALMYGEANDPEDIDTAFEDYAWLIELDRKDRADGTTNRLLALQIGIKAGSRYVLLRHRASESTTSLGELDWKCPAGAERRTARIDIWQQNACVISSKDDLRRIARIADRQPVTARWELTSAQSASFSENSDH
jgi:hypothetical protein